MEKEKNIYQKMLEATEKIQTVAKGLSVGAGKNTYKAVSERDVLEAVKPIEIESGIYSYPAERKIIEQGRYTVVKSYNGNESSNEMFMLRLETTYRFVNVDNPEEFIDVKTYGDGYDSQDKAPGKAMTYADKYALLKAYKIETGEDTDKEVSGKVKSKNKELDKEFEIDYKNKLKEKIEEKGLDMAEYARENKLSSKTTQAEAKKLYDELCKM